MTSAIITSESNKDLELLLELAKKLKLKTKILSEEEQENFGLAEAIKSGRTNEFIDTEKFLLNLQS